MTCCFGDVASDEMCLNDAGRMACRVWETLRQRFPSIEMDAFVVMPNHIHGIIIVGAQDNSVGMPLVDTQDPGTVGIPTPGATTRVAPTGGRVILGNVIGAYKSLTTFEYTRSVKTHSWSPFNGRLWQRNYYEHIVRDEESLGRIRQYIIDNPAQWMFDQENPMSGMPQDANP